MHYTLVAVVSLDGKIARGPHEPTDWSSPEDKKILHQIEDESDVIIVGNTTYQLAQAPLSKRNSIIFTRSVGTTREVNDKALYCNADNIDIQQLLQTRKYQKICILGGREVYNYFLEQDLIDTIILTIEPVIFGRGISLFETQSRDKRFTLLSHEPLNSAGTMLLRYQRAR